MFRDCGDAVTWDLFESKLSSRPMTEFFKTIDVAQSEAKYLFKLLDADSSGAVDTEEMVNGCLKMRGPATALEILLLMQWVRDMRDRLEDVAGSQGRLEDRIGVFCNGGPGSSLDQASSHVQSSTIPEDLPRTSVSEDEESPRTAPSTHNSRGSSTAQLNSQRAAC